MGEVAERIKRSYESIGREEAKRIEKLYKEYKSGKPEKERDWSVLSRDAFEVWTSRRWQRSTAQTLHWEYIVVIRTDESARALVRIAGYFPGHFQNRTVRLEATEDPKHNMAFFSGWEAVTVDPDALYWYTIWFNSQVQDAIGA